MAGDKRIRDSDGDDVTALANILERGFTRPVMDVQEVEMIRADVRRLMRMVRDRLAENLWDISQEARRVLDGLLEKNGFME